MLPAPRRSPFFLSREGLREVLENLPVNALRYTPPGGEVRVRCVPTEAAGAAWVTLKVEDTGGDTLSTTADCGMCRRPADER